MPTITIGLNSPGDATELSRTVGIVSPTSLCRLQGGTFFVVTDDPDVILRTHAQQITQHRWLNLNMKD